MKTGLRTFILIPILSAIFLLLSSCTFGNRTATHILILAVDQFGYENLKCNKEATTHQKSGIEILCQDSIRFTHAYTTSQQTRPALASLLTGLPPYLNHVQDNDGSSLPATIKTIAEVATRNGHETAFFISSPTTLRNSGLQQGFQLFDDHYLADKAQPYRLFTETKSAYLNWRVKQNKPTLTLIHISDLFFKNRPTQTEMGEARNYSYESQFDDFDFSLYQLLNSLKKEKHYDNTIIILAGLNSTETTDDNSEQILDFNQDQIALLIKPTQKPRDIGLAWTYDENVSLTDIGKTIFDYFQSENTNQAPEFFKNISLLPSQTNQHLAKLSDRWILSESTNTLRQRNISFRKNQFHVILQNGSYKIFNTLIDKSENSPLLTSDPIHSELTTEIREISQQVQKNSPEVMPNENINEAEVLLESVTGSKVKNTESIIKSLKSSHHDFAVLKERFNNHHSSEFQNICLQELESTKTTNQLKQCRDKKILFLNELRPMSSDINLQPSEAQKKKIAIYHSELKSLASALQLNQETGSAQIQPKLELKRWLPFLIALHLPAYTRVKSLMLKSENR